MPACLYHIICLAWKAGKGKLEAAHIEDDPLQLLCWNAGEPCPRQTATGRDMQIQADTCSNSLHLQA